MDATVTDGLITYREAASLVGVSINTVYGYVRRGLLARVDSGKRGVVAHFRASDVLAVRAAAKAWIESREARAAITEDGLKHCAKCKLMLPATGEHFAAASSRHSKSGLASWCRDCTRKASMAHYYATWEESCAVRRQYRRDHPEQCRQHRRAAYHRNPAKERAAIKAWYERNRESQQEWERHYKRSLDAIAWGKTSPITGRAGFALVITDKAGKGGGRDISYRAARLDKPFAVGEIALCRFMPPVCSTGLWGVSVWPVVAMGYREQAARIAGRRTSKARLTGTIGRPAEGAIRD